MARAAPNYSWLYYISISNIMANLICFIYCFGRLSANKNPIRYTLSATHATQHTNTHMAGKASPPPPSYTCLGPRESGKGQETNPAEGAGGGARPPKALPVCNISPAVKVPTSSTKLTPLPEARRPVNEAAGAGRQAQTCPA